VYNKSFGIGQFPVFPYAEESELALCWAAELARERQDGENGFNGGRWV
jgi:hypothetical protein